MVSPGGNSDSLPFVVAPLGGMAFRAPNADVTFATAIYAPEGGGYDRKDHAGQFQGEKIGLTRITYLSPSVAFEASENLFIGASLGFSWQGVALNTRLRTPLITLEVINNALDTLSIDAISIIHPYDTAADLEVFAEDNFSPSFNLGFLWKPSLWFSMGATYRSEATNQMQGDYQFSYSEAMTNMTYSLKELLGNYQELLGLHLSGSEQQTGEVKFEYVNPQYFAIGTSTQVTHSLLVNVDFKWVDYNEFKDITFHFSETTDLTSIASVIQGNLATNKSLVLPRNYESNWAWSVGFDYQYNAITRLRAGYEYRPSAAPDDHLDLLIPLSTVELFSIGMASTLDNEAVLEFGLAYAKSDYNIPACSSKAINDCGPGSAIYNPLPAVDISNSTKAYIMTLGYTNAF